MHRRDGQPGMRRVVALVGLVKKHGHFAVDEACSLALAAGAPTYRFVRTYLDRKPHPALSLRQVDPLIRDLTLYRDLIARKTEETQ
jgi:hypothetical protein